jgi:hypothetical protein
MHRAGVFLLSAFLMLMLVIVVAIRAIEINRPYLCNAHRKRRCTDKEENPFLYCGSHIFCSGSRVGCGGLGNAGGTSAATAEVCDPEEFRVLLG